MDVLAKQTTNASFTALLTACVFSSLTAVLTVPDTASAAADIQAPQVEVIGHYETGIGTTDAASAGVVNSTEVRDRPILRPSEVLEYVPGLMITQHSGDGKANQYFLRGFNLDHGTDFATWVAGMPVNNPTHAHGQGYTDLNFMIPELISKIDYHKGPYYADEGDFSSAGAAHIGYFDVLPENLISLTGGSWEYGRTLLAGSPELGGGHFLYGVEYVHNNGPWDLPEDFNKVNLVGRYSMGSGDHGWSLTGMFNRGRWNSTDQIAQRAVDSGLIGRLGAIDPTDGGNSQRSSLSWQSHDNIGLGDLVVDAYAIRYKLNLFSDFTYFLNDPVRGDQFEQSDSRTVLGVHPRLVLTDKWFGMNAINTIGLMVRRDNIDRVALFDTQAKQVFNTVRDDQVHETSTGVYFENNLQWTEKFRSVVGIRTDYYQFDVNSSLAVNSGNRKDHITSPKLSLIFGPWAKTEYFINYGEGFHSNDARGTTITVDPNPPHDPRGQVTPLVKSRGEEVGLRTEAIPKLQSSLSVWRLTLGSELIFQGDGGDTAASRPSLREGVEWSNHYKALPWLLFDVEAGVSRSRFTDFDPVGDHIPGSIAKYGSAGITVTDYGPWFGAVQLRYFGPRPLIEDNSITSKSTTLTYVRAGYKFDKHLRTNLDIYNLFNRKDHDIDYFYTSRLPGEPAAGVDDLHFHPVEPLSVRLTATYSY